MIFFLPARIPTPKAGFNGIAAIGWVADFLNSMPCKSSGGKPLCVIQGLSKQIVKQVI